MYILFRTRLIPKCILLQKYINGFVSPLRLKRSEAEQKIINTFIYVGDVNMVKQLVKEYPKITHQSKK